MPRKKIDEAVDEGHVKRDKNENWLEEEHAEWFVQILGNERVEIYG